MELGTLQKPFQSTVILHKEACNRPRRYLFTFHDSCQTSFPFPIRPARVETNGYIRIPWTFYLWSAKCVHGESGSVLCLDRCLVDSADPACHILLVITVNVA